MTDCRKIWPPRSRPRAPAWACAILAGLAGGLGSCARSPSVVALGPAPVNSIEPGRSFEAKGIMLRVDSVLVGRSETLVFLAVENQSRAWVETRALRGSRLVAAGQTLLARGLEGLSAGSPGVVAPGQTGWGRVRFPPLPAGSLGLRLSLPLRVQDEQLEAEFLVRLERGWKRP